MGSKTALHSAFSTVSMKYEEGEKGEKGEKGEEDEEDEEDEKTGILITAVTLDKGTKHS